MVTSPFCLLLSLALAGPSGAEAPTNAPTGAAALDQAAKIVEVEANTVKNLNRALELYDAGLQDAGIPARRRSLALTDMARARLRLGDLATKKKVKLGHYKKGKALAKKAQKLDDKNADAYFWEAANLAVIGRTNGVTSSLFMLDDLKKKLYKALELDPKHHYAKETIASIYHAVPGLLGGDDDKAEKLFQEILRADPQFTPTKVTYAKFLIDNGEEKKARKLLREVISAKTSSVPNDWRKFNRPDAKQTLARLDR